MELVCVEETVAVFESQLDMAVGWELVYISLLETALGMVSYRIYANLVKLLYTTTEKNT